VRCSNGGLDLHIVLQEAIEAGLIGKVVAQGHSPLLFAGSNHNGPRQATYADIRGGGALLLGLIDTA
jgi:hypothetical protein